MSAGRYTNVRYAAVYNNNAIHPIKVQPETLALSIADVENSSADTAITNPISAVVSKNKRAKGLRPSLVTLRWTGAAAAAPGNVGTTTIPVLNDAIRQVASTADDETEVTYLGVNTWVVAGYSAEEAK